jgi:ribonuclease HI
MREKKKKSCYVVVNGHNPGIYDKWFGDDGAANQVAEFPQAIYKGFYTREEALEWLKELGEETLADYAPNLLELLLEELPDEEQRQSAEDLLNAGKVLIYTDGGAITNPGPGGYGVVLRYKKHKKELSGGFQLTTNNRMELMACIEGLKALKSECEVVLFSDSMYAVSGIANGRVRKWQANGWKRGKKHRVENVDLWEQLLELCDIHQPEFRWIRGHTGNPDNERCDQLAMGAAGGQNLAIDKAYEDGETKLETRSLFSM